MREVGRRAQRGVRGRIEELGDLRVFGALETIDATGLTAAPLWDKALKVGDEVALPTEPERTGPSSRPASRPLSCCCGRLARTGTMRVERIVETCE